MRNFIFIFSLLLVSLLSFSQNTPQNIQKTLQKATQKITVADSIKIIHVRDSLRVYARDSLQNFLNIMLAEPEMQHATFGF